MDVSFSLYLCTSTNMLIASLLPIYLTLIFQWYKLGKPAEYKEYLKGTCDKSGVGIKMCVMHLVCWYFCVLLTDPNRSSWSAGKKDKGDSVLTTFTPSFSFIILSSIRNFDNDYMHYVCLFFLKQTQSVILKNMMRCLHCSWVRRRPLVVVLTAANQDIGWHSIKKSIHGGMTGWQGLAPRRPLFVSRVKTKVNC